MDPIVYSPSPGVNFDEQEFIEHPHTPPFKLNRGNNRRSWSYNRLVIGHPDCTCVKLEDSRSIIGEFQVKVQLKDIRCLSEAQYAHNRQRIADERKVRNSVFLR